VFLSSFKVLFFLCHQQRSPDVVLVSVLCLLNDELSVEQDEATHDDQPQVHVGLQQRTGRLWSDPVPLEVSPNQARLNVTLNSKADPRNMFMTDMRNRTDKPDIRVPGEQHTIYRSQRGLKRVDTVSFTGLIIKRLKTQ
jgi:hypothetical protein